MDRFVGGVLPLMPCLISLLLWKLSAAPGIHCPDIEPVLYADIQISMPSPHKVGSIARFTCDAGYKVVGKSSVACLKNGRWSGPTPYCTARTCQRKLQKVEKGRTCRKSCTSDAQCRGVFKRCKCDDWCGKSCFNPIADCGNLEAPTNGYLVERGISYGHTVTYGCDDGYMLLGPATRRCRSDRKWSGKPPLCISFSACGQPSEIKDSRFGGKVIRGNDAKQGAWPWQVLLINNLGYSVNQIYNINAGFGGGSIINDQWILSAAHVFTDFPSAFKSKNWKNTFLIVAGMTSYPRRDREIPEHIQIYEPEVVYKHKSFNEDNYDYDVALIRIGKRLKQSENNTGKFVVDEDSLDGTLLFSRYVRPVCLPCITKGPLEPVNILKNYVEKNCASQQGRQILTKIAPTGSSVMLTGFGLTTYPSDTGTYTLPTRLQQGQLIMIDDLKCAENVKDIRRHASQARYTKRMFCASGANASAKADACKGDSGGPVVVTVKRGQNTNYWIQIGITSWGWECGGAYPGFYTSVPSVMNWVWTILNGTRTDVCPPPPPFGDSFSTSERSIYKVGTSVEYTCRFGLSVVGNSSSQCLRSLKWSPPKHLCIPITCGEPDKPLNGYIEGNDFTFGKLITYHCNKGYVMENGDLKMVKQYCSSSGQWSGQPPICSKLKCEPPTSPVDGFLERRGSSLEFNATVTYRCDSGYLLVGNAMGRCNENGDWGMLPNCSKITCEIPEVENGRIAGENPLVLDSKIYFDCNSGYQLRGASVATCTPQGVSEELPTCVETIKYEGDCPSGFRSFQLMCYRIFKTSQTYDDAKATCAKYGANLATVQSSLVNSFIRDYAPSTPLKYTMWIGLRAFNNQRKWDSGFDYSGTEGVENNLIDGWENYCAAYEYNVFKFVPWLRWRITYKSCYDSAMFVCETWKSSAKSYSVSGPRSLRGVYQPVNGLLTSSGRQVYSNPSNIPVRYLYHTYDQVSNIEGWFIGDYNIRGAAAGYWHIAAHQSAAKYPNNIGSGRWRDRNNRITQTTIYDNNWWTGWGGYHCDVTCGQGMQTRTRRCNNGQPGSMECRGQDREMMPCILALCRDDSSIASQIHMDTTYLFFPESKTWHGARQACSRNKMELAIITNRVLSDILSSKSRAVNFEKRWGGNFWVNGRVFNGKWIYADATPMVETDVNGRRLWSPGEPSGHRWNNDCVELNGHGGLNDHGCGHNRRFICQAVTLKNPCDRKPCRGNRVCSQTSSGYRCDCPSGLVEPMCTAPEPTLETDEKDFGACASGPCFGNAKCTLDSTDSSGFVCLCKSGWRGRLCDKGPTTTTVKPAVSVWNHCDRKPCQNNGRCVNNEQGYRCECVRGYSGRNCENDNKESVCQLDSVNTTKFEVLFDDGTQVQAFPVGIGSGSSITFKCQRNGSTQSTSVTCVKGSWKTPIPSKCVGVTCSNVGELGNGSVIARPVTSTQPYEPGTRLSFKCDSFYILSGATATTCKEDGSWSLPIPQCKESGCLLFDFDLNFGAFVKNHEYEDLTAEPGDEYQLTCKSDRKKTQTVTCMGKDKWKPPVKDFQCE